VNYSEHTAERGYRHPAGDELDQPCGCACEVCPVQALGGQATADVPMAAWSGSGILEPKGWASRAKAAQMLMNF